MSVIENAKLTIKVGKEEIAEKMNVSVEDLAELCNYPRFKPSSKDGIAASIAELVEATQEKIAGADFGNEDAQAIAVESVAKWGELCVALFMGRKVMNDAAKSVRGIPELVADKPVKEDDPEAIALEL